MRRLITAVVVPIAIVGAFGITASVAEAKGFKTKAFLEEIAVPAGEDTWVFSGRIESRNDKCLGKRKVAIFVAPVRVGARGGGADEAFVKGRTKKNGKFRLVSDIDILVIAPYEAQVKQRKPKKGVKCKAGVSNSLEPGEEPG